MKFSKCSAVSVFQNWLYDSERKPRNTRIINSFDYFDFLFQPLKDSLFAYAKTMMLRLWILIRHLSTNLQHKFYCFFFSDKISDQVELSSAVKTTRSSLLYENNTLVICLPMKSKFSKFSGGLSFRTGIGQNRLQWKTGKTRKILNYLKSLIFFFCQAQFSLSSWIFWLDFTYIQPIYLCVKNYFNSRNPNNTQINYFLQTIAPLNFDCFLLKNSVSKFNILEKIIFDSSK